MPDPLLFIPGLACTGRLFSAQISGLAAERDCLVADHCSHDDPVELAAAILAKAPPRFALCGFSMGGYLALEIMRQAPARVSRLALLDTAAAADTDEQRARRLSLIDLAGKGGFDEVRELLMPLFLGKVAGRDVDLQAVVAAMIAETGSEAFTRQQTAILRRPDSRPHLAAIDCPTLVLTGADDMLTPVSAGEALKNGIPGASFLVLPDCGHLTPLEAPGAVTAALRDWLTWDVRGHGLARLAKKHYTDDVYCISSGRSKMQDRPRVPVRRRRTQQERREDTRAALIEGMLSALIEVGYSRATTGEVTRRAGLSSGALQHHFMTKDDLVLAAVEYQFSEVRAQLEAVSNDSAADWKHFITRLRDIFAGRRYMAIWEIVLGTRADPTLHAKVLQHRVQSLKILQSLWEKVVADRFDDKQRCSDAMHFTMSVFRGSVFYDTIAPDGNFAERQKEMLFDFLEGQMKTRSTG